MIFPEQMLTVLGQQGGTISQGLQDQPEVAPLRPHEQQGLQDGEELNRGWGAAHLGEEREDRREKREEGEKREKPKKCVSSYLLHPSLGLCQSKRQVPVCVCVCIYIYIYIYKTRFGLGLFSI